MQNILEIRPHIDELKICFWTPMVGVEFFEKQKFFQIAWKAASFPSLGSGDSNRLLKSPNKSYRKIEVSFLHRLQTFLKMTLRDFTKFVTSASKEVNLAKPQDFALLDMADNQSILRKICTKELVQKNKQTEANSLVRANIIKQ